MTTKFTVICIDPPYGFSDTLSMSNTPRGALANYKTMPLEDIKKLPVKDLADPEGAILALWVPSSLLIEGLEVMKAYGFDLKQTYVWVKIKNDPFAKFKSWFKKNSSKDKKIIIDNINELDLNNSLGFGLGRTFRNCHEICLIGINSTKIYKKLLNKSQRTVSLAPNEKHSKKPEHLQNSLDIMFGDCNKIELFARRTRKGWISLGNEIDGQDIRDAILKYI